MGDKFSDAGNAIRDFLAGIGDSLVGTVKGLLTLVVDLGLLYVHSECSRMTLGHVPETLDQEVEKIKQKYEPLFKDPVNTIGGIGQSICDTADEKGVAYSSGYIVTEVVTALLADKGLDKIKNVAKTGKTADNVADIAEGAAKGAGNAAEDAGKAGKGLEGAANGAESAAEDAGKAGKTAGKVGESGRESSIMDYSNRFADSLAEDFNPGVEVRDVVKEDMILVQFSSDAPNASLRYWTTIDEANGISTIEEYMDKMALSKEWGNRNVVKVARVKKGTEVTHAIGTAKAQTKISDPRPGNGKQILFSKFDSNWITEVRNIKE